MTPDTPHPEGRPVFLALTLLTWLAGSPAPPALPTPVPTVRIKPVGKATNVRVWSPPPPASR